MKPIDRSEILDLDAYEAIRERFRARVIEEKKARRVSVGEHMTFVFENRDTVLFQIQEMLRAERITSERGIAHEIETYNDLLPAPGELSATLLIEYEDKAERAAALATLHDLGRHVALHLGPRRVAAVLRPLPGEEPGRLPAINYLRFPVGAGAREALLDPALEVTLEVDHPWYRAATTLGRATRRSLAEDP